MKKTRFFACRFYELSNRRFTFKELSNISDENVNVFPGCIDTSKFEEDDSFELKPLLILTRKFGEQKRTYLRTLVTKVNESQFLAHQDLTYEQWELGEEISKEPIRFSDKLKGKFQKNN